MKEILLQWEEDNLRHFIVKDQRYLDNLESRWDEYHQSKEQEKIKRVRYSKMFCHTVTLGQNFIIKQIVIWHYTIMNCVFYYFQQQMKNETTMMEMKFGSKPQTPTPKRYIVYIFTKFN